MSRRRSGTLVLLHGWGLGREVWQTTLAGLGTRAAPPARALDLPGYGSAAPADPADDLGAVAGRVLADLPSGPVTLAGWSLGGLVAMRVALTRPARVAHLVLVGASPQFVADPRWPHAVDGATLEAFAAQMLTDRAGTIRRFLALQVIGSERSRPTLGALREALSAAPEPDPEALAGGLHILREVSLLGELDRLRVPVTLIHGDRDTLAPLAGARAAARRLADATLCVIPGAGHAPFLSHPEAFLEALAP